RRERGDAAAALLVHRLADQRLQLLSGHLQLSYRAVRQPRSRGGDFTFAPGTRRAGDLDDWRWPRACARGVGVADRRRAGELSALGADAAGAEEQAAPGLDDAVHGAGSAE